VIGVDIACNKAETKFLLREAAIKVPEGKIISNNTELEKACNTINYPVAIKPLDGNHGRGITSAIKNIEEATVAFKRAKEISHDVIVEKHISGADYRMLVINYKFVAAAKRSPAQITGDGKLSIEKLVEKENQDPRRGYGHENVLTKIELDKISLQLIEKKGYNLQSILPENEILILKDTANLSTGGTAKDVTEIVHPSNIFMTERIARLIDLDVCGIDIITSDISKPIEETGGCVIEVNAGPGFRMHLSPTEGLPRNVAAPVLDSLFPDKKESRKNSNSSCNRYQWKNHHDQAHSSYCQTKRKKGWLYNF